MKKGEQPELSAKWWVGSQPKGLKSAGKLELSLKAYENAKKKLESNGADDAATFAADVLGQVETAVGAVIAEASKDKKNPEMGFTVDALKKFDKLFGAEQVWIEVHAQEDDDGMFSDPEVYQAYLTKGLKRLRSGGQMNFGLVLGKKAEEHRLAVHKSKAPKALASMVAKETGLHAFTFGTAVPDEEKPMTLRLNLEGRQLPGLKKKGERMLKKFKPQPFQHIILMLEGKEVEDLADPDDTDVDEADEAQGPAPVYDAAALKRELAGLIVRVQGLQDPTLKQNLARLANRANAGLNGNSNLEDATAAIDELRKALDGAANGQGGANGGQATANTEAYTKSRDIWLATRKRVESEIEKLRSQIAATYQQDGIAGELDRLYSAKVAPVLTSLDESLAAKLNEATNEADATRRTQLVAEARDIITRYQTYVAGDQTIPQLDKNPFVELSIQQTVTQTLSALVRTVH